MSEQGKIEPFDYKTWISESMSFKVVLIIGLILIMLIPEQMVNQLVHERMSRSNEVINEISAKRGGVQKLDGPVLTIPLLKSRDARSYVHIIPEKFNLSSDVVPEIRKRGIFEAVVYTSSILIDAEYRVPTEEELGLMADSLDLENAVISFGVSDPGGIAGDVTVAVDGDELRTKPGISVPIYLERGFHTPVDLRAENRFLKMKAQMNLNGSQELHFVPLGRSSEITMKSSWKDPSFTGEFLTTKHEIKENGFEASWNVHELQSNIKPVWYDAGTGKRNPSIGVNLIQVNDPYQRILRVIKYAILFISFTFAAVFISERVTGVSIHPLQYLLTGIASLFFYIFLLSLSEHMAFNTAYGLTSLIITLMISGYAKGMFNSFKMATTMGGISSLLYLFLFGTLQMEDYALLMGSTGLLFVLAIVMYLTKNINREQELVQA